VTDGGGGQEVKPVDPTDISSEELERRIGGDQPSIRRVSQARRVRTRGAAVTPELRRRILWRDSATILAGVLLAIVGAKFLIPGNAPSPTGSPTAEASGIAIGSFGTATLPGFTPIPTLGQIINPSLDLEATPTPIPVITLPPITPRPSTGPTQGPGSTPKPTVKPSATPHASSTPTPAPVAAFSCTPSAGLVLTCTDQSTNATGWTWNWGDNTSDTGQTPPPHTYSPPDPSPVSVTLTVTGPGGTDSETIFFNLIP
jgi:hypothetical protein